MKTLFSLFFLLVFSIGSMANPGLKELKENTRIKAKNQLVRVHFKTAIDKVALRLTDKAGKTLFNGTYQTKEPVIIPINLSQLAEGIYVLHVIGEEGSNRYEIESRKKVVLPLMAYGKKVGPNKVSLLVVGLEKPGTLVKFFDQTNRVLLNETIDEPGGFRKDYVFDQIQVKDLTLKVTDASGREKYIRFDN
ncbi:DUF3244 domain-containing protein [Cyclobacterium jeungdonense]|uniref:Por secretion system C-terminal sorting domain-containing protein n=1 Tax=Cyclobacterium jeungdonense TaxID=708087 RepID=A0ABT8CFT5_9BACT|nr:hypothetical protein [Cyclobacterium jeungdonense]MDN3690633.1 hypothetical protein [Cyclobacterium jeungdonense]